MHNLLLVLELELRRLGLFNGITKHMFLTSMGKKRAKAVNQNQNEPTPGAKRTLFLRNLDFNVTSDGLTNVFKEYGPIQSCFVVSDSRKYYYYILI